VTTRERYTIDNPVAGFIEAHGKRDEALGRAKSLAKLTGIRHFVFDRMARDTYPQEWAVEQDGSSKVLKYKGC
jgi:hypothetical protein